MLNKIVVSSSLMMVAVNAFASVKAPIVVDEEVTISDAMQEAISAAMAKRDVKQSVASALPTFVQSLSKNGKTLSEQFFGDRELVAWVTDDSTISDISSCYSNCYSNCHSNCHGSRGWR